MFNYWLIIDLFNYCLIINLIKSAIKPFFIVEKMKKYLKIAQQPMRDSKKIISKHLR